MQEINSIISKFNINQTSPFLFEGELFNSKISLLKERLPNLNQQQLIGLASILQSTELDKFSNEDLEILSNIGLHYLEFQGEVTKLDKPILNEDSPAFDIGGVVISQDFDRNDIYVTYKRALSSNKSISQSFIVNYITNIG